MGPVPRGVVWRGVVRVCHSGAGIAFALRGQRALATAASDSQPQLSQRLPQEPRLCLEALWGVTAGRGLQAFQRGGRGGAGTRGAACRKRPVPPSPQLSLPRPRRASAQRARARRRDCQGRWATTLGGGRGEGREETADAEHAAGCRELRERTKRPHTPTPDGSAASALTSFGGEDPPGARGMSDRKRGGAKQTLGALHLSSGAPRRFQRQNKVNEPQHPARREQGAWSTEHGAWSLEHGAWSLEHRAWSTEPGARSLEHGAWSMEPGARSLEPGARSLEPGARSLEPIS
ncbi:hypothetical protein QTO34_012893 [Cnephaeus nilssonii]|uniref:Uncharacterized protein n=1 Tax=Cnephaeus nilssonii TaxID=3371016 RepID=A0AA40HAP3_CNENI|nr:hypothetical protein QTO34_012893 [Eptesicus nilssonii]